MQTSDSRKRQAEAAQGCTCARDPLDNMPLIDTGCPAHGVSNRATHPTPDATPGPAEATNDDVEALAEVLWAATVRGATAGEPLLHEEADNLAGAVLASGWLAADRARVRAEGDVLTALRVQGNSRRDRWHTPDTEPWTGADWSNAMCGEAGEAANVVKKLRRIETGTGAQDQPSEAELRQMLADELGDVLAYADLLAQHYGIDLRKAVADKFNRVSVREGFPERIELRGMAEAGESDA